MPPTGFVITTIISDDIALSLGLVGALSIVRFRTPVKNPLELVNYFILITIGIVLSVSITMSLFFILYLGPILLVTKKFVLKDKFNNINEPQRTKESNILRISIKKDNQINVESVVSQLLYENKNKNNEITYSLIFQNYSEAKKFVESLGKEIIEEYSIEKYQSE